MPCPFWMGLALETLTSPQLGCVSTLLALLWRCKCCATVDNTLVSYFDREPFAPICCGLFSGHFFKERCYWNPLLIFPAAGLYFVTFGFSLFFCPWLHLGFNNVRTSRVLRLSYIEHTYTHTASQRHVVKYSSFL